MCRAKVEEVLPKSRVRENFKHGSVRGRAVEAFYSTCTAACGVQERPCKAQLGTGRPRIGGVDKMQTSLGAGATAHSAGALRTPFLAASMGGRAAWPTVRHLADKIGLPFRSQDGR